MINVNRFMIISREELSDRELSSDFLWSCFRRFCHLTAVSYPDKDDLVLMWKSDFDELRKGKQ